jgi:F0F1-type ATP synthase delta subunit
MNADGSGNIQLLVDLGKIGKNLQQQNQNFGLSFIDQVKKAPHDADSLLKNCKGISNVKTRTENEKGIYMISFDFKNSKALNNAIYCIARQNKTSLLPDIYKISNHKLSRKNLAPLLKKLINKDKSNVVSDMLYQFINFESTYDFPSPTKKVSNIKATSENGDKTVKLKYTLYELMNNDFDYGISIKY